MKTQQKILTIAASFGFLIFLIVAFATPATHGSSDRTVIVHKPPEPQSLLMLARVVRYCEKNDKPMHPDFVRWAAASMPTGDNQLAQTGGSKAAGLFQKE